MGGRCSWMRLGRCRWRCRRRCCGFLECGELQRVGDNETMRVDVRVIAATHQPLEQRSGGGTFRLDLYHRLAVFPLEIPALRERMEDLPLLVERMLSGADGPGGGAEVGVWGGAGEAAGSCVAGQRAGADACAGAGGDPGGGSAGDWGGRDSAAEAAWVTRVFSQSLIQRPPS